MLRIGNLELGKVPRVVGVVDEVLPAASVSSLQDKGVDIFEIRVDRYNLSETKLQDYLKEIRSAVSSPLIGTVRETEQNRQNRLTIFKSMVPFVDCVDIELGTPIWKEMLDAASGKLIMVSEHDFEKTPDRSGLEDLVKRSIDQGAQVVKIAVMAHTAADVTRLLRFTEDCDVPLVTIAMGEVGTVSRVIAPLFKSLFTYGFLGESVAPGQLSARKLAEELDLYFPRRRNQL